MKNAYVTKNMLQICRCVTCCYAKETTDGQLICSMRVIEQTDDCYIKVGSNFYCENGKFKKGWEEPSNYDYLHNLPQITHCKDCIWCVNMPWRRRSDGQVFDEYHCSRLLYGAGIVHGSYGCCAYGSAEEEEED